MATYEAAVILPAYVACNVIQDTSETISTTLRDNAVVVLNQLLSSNSAERLMAYAVYHQSFTPIAGTKTYTLGTGGTFVSTVRPVAVTGWKSTSGAFERGGEPVSFDVLRQRQKNDTGRGSVLPEMIAADQLYPSINIEIFPVPATSPGTLVLDYWGALTAVAYTDTVTVPDGWERYLTYGLARELSVRYPMGGEGRQELDRLWQESKSIITARVAAILAPPQVAA